MAQSLWGWMMAKDGVLATFEPRAAHFGNLIRELHRDLRISASTLAPLFETTSQNIRVIASRTAATDERPLLPVPLLTWPHSIGDSVRVGVRFQSAAMQRKRKLGERRAELSEILATRRSRYEFATAIRELSELLRRMGQPGNPDWIALKGEIHHQISWFAGHLGMSATAVGEARRAMDLFRLAFHEAKHSRRAEHARDFIRSGLPGANSALLSRDPATALLILSSVEAAAQAMSLQLGSEYHRLRGVAFFQLADDEESRTEFEAAARAMHDLEEPEKPATVRMVSDRHLYLLGNPNYDMSAELRMEAAESFGVESLEYSMATNWTAAAALASETKDLDREALKLLTANRALAANFGHQASSTKLLLITQELKLGSEWRRRFIRRALYENTFRMM